MIAKSEPCVFFEDMSDILKEFTHELLVEVDDIKELGFCYALACTAWNASFDNEREQHEQIKLFLKNFDE